MKILSFFRSVKDEITHINWPTKQNVTLVTIAVILASLLVAYYLGFFDWLFKTLLERYVLGL